jgi:hypothetical protein
MNKSIFSTFSGVAALMFNNWFMIFFLRARTRVRQLSGNQHESSGVSLLTNDNLFFFASTLPMHSSALIATRHLPTVERSSLDAESE